MLHLAAALAVTDARACTRCSIPPHPRNEVKARQGKRKPECHFLTLLMHRQSLLPRSFLQPLRPRPRLRPRYPSLQRVRQRRERGEEPARCHPGHTRMGPEKKAGKVLVTVLVTFMATVVTPALVHAHRRPLARDQRPGLHRGRLQQQQQQRVATPGTWRCP